MPVARTTSGCRDLAFSRKALRISSGFADGSYTKNLVGALRFLHLDGSAAAVLWGVEAFSQDDAQHDVETHGCLLDGV